MCPDRHRVKFNRFSARKVFLLKEGKDATTILLHQVSSFVSFLFFQNIFCREDRKGKKRARNSVGDGAGTSKGNGSGVGEEGAMETGDGRDVADGNDNSKGTNSSSLAKSGAHFLNI